MDSTTSGNEHYLDVFDDMDFIMNTPADEFSIQPHNNASDNNAAAMQLDDTLKVLFTNKTQAVKDENYSDAQRLKEEITEVEKKKKKLLGNYAPAAVQQPTSPAPGPNMGLGALSALDELSTSLQPCNFESQASSSSSSSSSSKKNPKKTKRKRKKKNLALINSSCIKSKQPNLSCAVKQGHDLYFSNQTHFFGCYWRNKSSSLCGFPTAQGLDYVTFQAQNRNQTAFTKTVVVGFEIDAESMSKYETFIFKAELNAFRDLPDNDYSLIGNIGTFADTIKPFSFYVAVPASEAIAIPPVNSTESLNSSTQLNSSTAFTEFTAFTAFTPKKYKISVEITPNKWTLAAKMGNVKGQTKIDMIHSPITNISNADKERISHPSSTTSVKTILVKNLSCLNVMVYGTKKSCQTFTGTSEAEAATRGPAKMISKKPMSPIVVADSSSSSSCINTECEILGVLRSPAFLVGSSRSLRNKYSIPFHKGKFDQRIQQTCTSSVKTLHCAASVSETNNTSTFQSISSISSDGTLSADFTDSSEHSREHTCSPELSAEKEVEPSVRPNKRAKISNIDNNNGGNDDNGNTNTNVGSEIMPIEFLLGLTNSCC